MYLFKNSFLKIQIVDYAQFEINVVVDVRRSSKLKIKKINALDKF